MTVKITIVGMGQIGTSVGLALAEKTDLVYRVGHDRELKIAQQAQKMGALDKVSINLPSAVSEADLVLLSLPTDQIRETMSVIAADLKEGAVVMDTAPVKEVVLSWAREFLTNGRYYVGLTPVINPIYLQNHDSGIEAAHADLFRGGMMAIVASPPTPSEAIKLASDLTRLLGSTPLFADPVEVDSLMAATHILPQLLAAALLNSTVDQPGWREARKLAGRAFAEVTGPIVQLGEPEALCSAAMLARDNVLRVTDSVIAALQAFRNDIKNQEDKALTQRLERARNGRERWWIERQAANWAAEDGASDVEAPKASEIFGRLIGLGRKPKPKNL
ncbi:MAG: prephenate dehydrogenase [Chloroflexota bacterium]|nr:MAG: prephenate dehydrogenase [Chloroflexota bacterium]